MTKQRVIDECQMRCTCRYRGGVPENGLGLAVGVRGSLRGWVCRAAETYSLQQYPFKLFRGCYVVSG